MKQSGFLKQQEAIRQELVAAAERITRQLMLDAAQIVLHNEFGWGYERIKRFSDALASATGIITARWKRDRSRTYTRSTWTGAWRKYCEDGRS